MANPLPHLRARYFARGGVLHQIEKRDCAATAEPRLQVLNADRHILAEPGFSDRLVRCKIEKIRSRHVYLLTFARNLVWRFHDRVEGIGGQIHHPRMRHPCAVVAVARFALLVFADFGKRFFIRGGIILNRNPRRHSAHRECVSPVTSLDAKQRIRAHEMRRHRDERAIGQNEILFRTESFDAGKNVVPSAAVQSR